MGLGFLVSCVRVCAVAFCDAAVRVLLSLVFKILDSIHFLQSGFCLADVLAAGSMWSGPPDVVLGQAVDPTKSKMSSQI